MSKKNIKMDQDINPKKQLEIIIKRQILELLRLIAINEDLDLKVLIKKYLKL